LPDGALKAIYEGITKGAPANSICHIERLGGKIDDPSFSERSSYAHRGGLFWVNIIGTYSIKGKVPTEATMAKVDKWLEDLAEVLTPLFVVTPQAA